MGSRWINVAEESLSRPVSITLPYAEAGYFGADEVRAVAFYFIAKQGERITVRLSLISQNSFHVFTDLFQSGSGTAKSYKLLASMAPGDSIFDFDADKTDTFILRIQPELRKVNTGSRYLQALPSASRCREKAALEVFMEIRATGECALMKALTSLQHAIHRPLQQPMA